MKKFFIFLILPIVAILLLSPAYSIPPVYASGTPYLRVITADTPFYKNQGDELPLFYLPYTYYVKVLDDSGEMLRVECFGEDFAAIDGYVPKNLLYEDGQSVSSPYPSITIRTSTDAVLYQDSGLSVAVLYVFPERDMRYYGTYSGANGNLYYVSYNGRLGYVQEEDVYPFTISNHPNELTFIEQEEIEKAPSDEKEKSENSTEDFFSLKIIIIVCLLFAGLVALFVALKGNKKATATGGYYDENEYE